MSTSEAVVKLRISGGKWNVFLKPFFSSAHTVARFTSIAWACVGVQTGKAVLQKQVHACEIIASEKVVKLMVTV